jgi:hypothetical protein
MTPLYEHPIKLCLLVDENGTPIPLTGSTGAEYDTTVYTCDEFGHMLTIVDLLAGVTVETTTYTWGTVAGPSVILSEVIT